MTGWRCAVNDEIETPPVVVCDLLSCYIGHPLLGDDLPFSADRLARDFDPSLLDCSAATP